MGCEVRVGAVSGTDDLGPLASGSRWLPLKGGSYRREERNRAPPFLAASGEKREARAPPCQFRRRNLLVLLTDGCPDVDPLARTAADTAWTATGRVRTVCAADEAPGIRRHARAGAAVDALDLVPGRRGGPRHLATRVPPHAAARDDVATIGLLVDGWPRAFPIVAVPDMRVTTTAARARLGLPLRENETETMYGAIAQARPVFNGYSGYSAPHHFAMRDLLEHYDPRILDRLAASETIEVVLENARDGGGEGAATWRRTMAPGVSTSGPSGPAMSFDPPARLLQSRSRARRCAWRRSRRRSIPAISERSSTAISTRAGTRRRRQAEKRSWPISEPSAHVAAVVLCLGVYPGQYPRGLTVEVSTDNVEWSTVYTGGTALETYDAALRSPREVPVTLPVRRDRVRFVRLRQTETTPVRMDDRGAPRDRMTTSSNARAVTLAALAYTLLAIAYTWPLPLHLPHGVAHDAGDPILNAWILWWTTKALPLTAHWWNAPIFFPAIGTLAFSEHLLGQAPIAAPHHRADRQSAARLQRHAHRDLHFQRRSARIFWPTP